MVRVRCINKSSGDHENPYVGITNFGWINPSTGRTGNSSRPEMVEYLERGNTAYTQDALGRRAWLQVRISSRGNKYVQTVADGYYSDNLLALMECRA